MVDHFGARRVEIAVGAARVNRDVQGAGLQGERIRGTQTHAAKVAKSESGISRRVHSWRITLVVVCGRDAAYRCRDD